MAVKKHDNCHTISRDPYVILYNPVKEHCKLQKNNEKGEGNNRSNHDLIWI